MKGWPSFNPSQKTILENGGCSCEEGNIINDAGYFDVLIPLNIVLGFAEDYRKIIVNMKHELILLRSRSDLNAIIQTIEVEAPNNTYEEFKIDIFKIEWLMPYVQLSPENRIQLLRQIEKNRPFSISFRSWELYEYPVLPASSRQVWTVKTTNQLEKPRFVILAFQTNKKNQRSENASSFNHCHLSNVKLFLNSQSYPYSNLNLDLENNRNMQLYMICMQRKKYHKKNIT